MRNSILSSSIVAFAVVLFGLAVFMSENITTCVANNVSQLSTPAPFVGTIHVYKDTVKVNLPSVNDAYKKIVLYNNGKPIKFVTLEEALEHLRMYGWYVKSTSGNVTIIEHAYDRVMSTTWNQATRMMGRDAYPTRKRK